jgi:putative endonuclease
MKDRGRNRIALGQLGESLALAYLERAGLKVLKQNYRCPKGEMDIVAQDGEWIVFVEVRTKTSGSMGYAEESITAKKVQRLRNIAKYYLLEKGYVEWPPLRFDLIAILYRQESEIKWIQGIL